MLGVTRLFFYSSEIRDECRQALAAIYYAFQNCHVLSANDYGGRGGESNIDSSFLVRSLASRFHSRHTSTKMIIGIS